jgi:hypothetical protein
LGLETHVKHAVSLVEDEVGNTAEVGAASLEHVDQTTGCSNADLDTTGQVANLRTLGDTTVDTGVANARGLAELADLGLNLDSQLTSRSEDEDDGTITRGKERLSVDVNNSGQTVRQSLSGTGLGNTDNVTSGESHGPTLRLNGSGTLEALGLNLGQNVGRETSLIEGLDGARDTTASDGHLVLLAESLNLGIGAGRDIGVLLVEGLLELGESVQVPVLGLEASTEIGHTVTASSASSAITTAAAAVAAATTTTVATRTTAGVTAAVGVATTVGVAVVAATGAV